MTDGTIQNSQLLTAKHKVMAEIKRLEKLHKNQHGGYEFTSIDDFKDEIRPLMAKHDLSYHVTEDSYTLSTVKSKDGKESNVAIIRFKFVLEHGSGERSEPSFSTVILPYTGAQTTGAAQSYAIKEGVYKGLLQASSGDMSEEADLKSQAPSERLPKADAKPLYEALQREMRAIESESRDSNEMANWWKENFEQINQLPVDWFHGLKKEYADTWKKLKANEDADLIAKRSVA
jgi:hypothetical protein